MSSILAIVLFVVSLTVVVKGADYFVRGAASIAAKLGISPFVVGLTIVAIGTSAPEVVVNVLAAYKGATALSVGNILGSNIVNVTIGLGLAALITPLAIKKQTVWKEIPFVLLASVLVLVLGSDCLVEPQCGDNMLGRTDAFALLAFFLIFIVYTFGLTRVRNEEEEDIAVYAWARSIVFTVGGIVALVGGGKVAVDSAVAIAVALGLSQNLIGLTIVAVGTSLPEIVTALIAVRAGRTDFVVGGIVGSMIFNTFFALGLTALVRPLPFTPANTTDALVLIAVTAALFGALFVGRRHTLSRTQGALFVATYVVYIAFAIWRG